jgi:hypothetical protein
MRTTRRRPALLLLGALLLPGGCSPSPAGKHQADPAALSTQAAREPTSTTAPAGDRVRFVDITAQAGIHWTHYSGARGKKYMPEIESGGCAFLDYDGDGRPDILLLNGMDWPEVTSGRKPARLALYHNDGNGHFTDATQGSGLDREMYAMGVAVGDYDNDGRDDLYITCVLGPSRLFHNEGKGRFKDVTAQAGVENGGQWGTSAAWVDYDRDGRLDLVVGNYCRWTPETDRRCSVYAGEKSYCTPQIYEGQSVRLYHNEGPRGFRDVSSQAGLIYPPGKTWGVTILDYDDDGWPDIALSNDLEPNCLFHNEHNGTFREVGMVAGIALPYTGSPRAGMGIDAADIDNSGRPSLLISNFAGEGISLFHNEGGGQFRDASDQWQVHQVSLQLLGWGLFCFDYDLDGRQDLLVVNGHLYDNIQKFHPDQTYLEPPLLFHNEGGKFIEVGAAHGSDLVRPMAARGAAYADIDGDGDVDILLLENSGAPRLLRNDGGNHNHWLRVHTVGVTSNRDGIGAKVHVEADGVQQTQWVKSGSSYLSASEQTLTFGLGQAAKVDSLIITWPSGQKDRYVGLSANQTLTAREGATQK